jgi:hypothetical protein
MEAATWKFQCHCNAQVEATGRLERQVVSSASRAPAGGDAQPVDRTLHYSPSLQANHCALDNSDRLALTKYTADFDLRL